MEVRALSSRLQRFLAKKGLRDMFQKQIAFFSHNPRHPSLHTELLEPKHLRFYSFRLTQKYRVIFIYCGNDAVEIIDINNHYA